jgi:hypothetical protein
MVSTQAPGIAARKAGTALEGLLNNVLGIGTIPREPVCQPVGVDEMRQKHLGETGLFRRIVHIQADATSPVSSQGLTTILPVI